ncbi:MAG: carbohydrate kinase family protein [Candidatus Korarchaeota archaeon]|nr:carbohydrate kinase family protein [Candidatus Korarchaeota archaeon]
MESLPSPGGDVRAREALLISPGGASVNFAVAASRLGQPSAVVGKVAGDPAGLTILDFLRREGVDTGGLTVSTSCGATGVVVSLVDGSGERTMISYLPRAVRSSSPTCPGAWRGGRGSSTSPGTPSFRRARGRPSLGWPQRSAVRAIPEATLSEALGASDLILPNLSEVEALRRIGLWEGVSSKSVIKLGGAGSRPERSSRPSG